MVVPNSDPGKDAVVLEEIEIGAVGGVTLAVVVKRKDFLVRQRNALDGRTRTVVAVLVLVNVVPEMDNIIHSVLARHVSVRIEESKSYDS